MKNADLGFAPSLLRPRWLRRILLVLFAAPLVLFIISWEFFCAWMKVWPGIIEFVRDIWKGQHIHGFTVFDGDCCTDRCPTEDEED
jgi:hypothetical protein